MARIYHARTSSRAYRDRARRQRRTFFGGALKWILYTVVACILCVAEDTAFALGGASVMGDGGTAVFFLPVWVTAAALCEGYRSGARFGVVIGLLASAAGGGTLYLLPLLYMAYGLLWGYVGTRFLRRGAVLYLFCSVGVCLLHALVQGAASVIAVLQNGETPIGMMHLLWQNGLRAVIATVLWSLPLWLISAGIRRLAGRFEVEE